MASVMGNFDHRGSWPRDANRKPPRLVNVVHPRSYVGGDMRIAVMMRAMDQDSGFHAYVEGLIESMLGIDYDSRYLLLYRTTKWFGRFAAFKNATEVLLWAPHKLIWDQLAVPYRAYQERADIIFNPKFTVPLISSCPVAMVLAEPAPWIWPEHYERWDVRYMRTMLPLYCRKADHLFALSNFILEENRRYLGLPFDDTTVTYPAPSGYFRPIDDPASLERFRTMYQLPPRFILAVTRVDHPGLDKSRSWHPGKNVETTLRAFALCRDRIPHKLVIAGRRVHEYLLQAGWSSADFEGVHFLGFVPHKELPELYNLADLFVLPSFYEGFGFTLAEAMACRCPVIASQTGSCPEISGGAALLADPYDPSDFAQKMLAVLRDEDLRQELKKKSLERAAFFSWEETARLTLKGLTSVLERPTRRRKSAA
jgi:glycosyltransferase involved in cell wall biosynthesis